MAQAVLSYGRALTDAIAACPVESSASEILRGTVLAVTRQAVAHPKTRMTMEIAAKYPAAREAQLSRFGEVQQQVAEAYAVRLKATRAGGLAAKMLAGLTLSLIDTVLQQWFEHEGQGVAGIVNQVFLTLGQLVCGDKI